MCGLKEGQSSSGRCSFCVFIVIVVPIAFCPVRLNLLWTADLVALSRKELLASSRSRIHSSKISGAEGADVAQKAQDQIPLG